MNLFQDLTSMFVKNQFKKVLKAKDYIAVGIDKGNRPGTPVKFPEVKIATLKDLATTVGQLLEQSDDALQPFERLRVLNVADALLGPVESTSLVTFAKTISDNQAQIAFNERVVWQGTQENGSNQFGRRSSIESETVYTNTGAQLVAHDSRISFSGSGPVSFVVAQIADARIKGTGDQVIEAFYGHSNQLKFQNEGNSAVTFAIAHHNTVQWENADSLDVDNLYGIYNAFEDNSGMQTLQKAHQIHLRWKNDNTSVGDYVGIYHQFDLGAANVANNAYFFHNITDIPSKTAGEIIAKGVNPENLSDYTIPKKGPGGVLIDTGIVEDGGEVIFQPGSGTRFDTGVEFEGGSVTSHQDISMLDGVAIKFVDPAGPTTDAQLSSVAGSGKLNIDGSLQLDDYGSGSITGTAAYSLSVDASGNVIETAAGSGSGITETAGTWQPRLESFASAGNTAGSSVNYGIRKGRWVRHGNIVYAQFHVSTNGSSYTKSNVSGAQVEIHGFPYDAVAGANLNSITFEECTGFTVQLQGFSETYNTGYIGNIGITPYFSDATSGSPVFYNKATLKETHIDSASTSMTVKGTLIYETNSNTLNSGATIP